MKKAFRISSSAVLGISAVAGVIVLISVGCKKQPPPKEMPPKAIETATAVQKDVQLFIESFGNLYSPSNVDIKSQATGEIQEVHFKDGDVVRKGDKLFTVDPSQSKAALDRAQAQLAQDQAELQYKQTTLERNRNLLAQELISKQEFDRYSTDVESAKAQISLDNSSVETAKINLSYCYINSPIEGVCGKRQVDPGNLVTANQGPTLVNIKTTNPLYIDFTVPEGQLDKIRSAMSKGRLKVEINLEQQEDTDNNPATPDVTVLKPYPQAGELKFLDNAVDNVTGTIQLRAVIPNKENKLWSGQFVRVHLNIGSKKDAVVVPSQAVQMGQRDGKNFGYVFVVTPDKKAQLREVITRTKADDFNVVIDSGVAAGETVVTAGQLGLRDGSTVEIEQ